MTSPDDLDVEKALIFFHAYMYGPVRGKMRLYSARGVTPRVAMSEDWELFASILIQDRGVSVQGGLDLERYEVKSAAYRSSFEYQYHRNSWQEKLDKDRSAGHLFISHKDGLRFVEVRYCAGSTLGRRNARTRTALNSVSGSRYRSGGYLRTGVCSFESSMARYRTSPWSNSGGRAHSFNNPYPQRQSLHGLALSLNSYTLT